jgi:hypothetical protein
MLEGRKKAATENLKDLRTKYEILNPITTVLVHTFIKNLFDSHHLMMILYCRECRATLSPHKFDLRHDDAYQLVLKHRKKDCVCLPWKVHKKICPLHVLVNVRVGRSV